MSLPGGLEIPGDGTEPPPPLRHSVGFLFLYRALDSHPLFPSLRWVAVFCRPLRPVFLLVSLSQQRSPVVGILGLRWLLWGSCHGLPSMLRSSTTRLAAFPWARGPPPGRMHQKGRKALARLCWLPCTHKTVLGCSVGLRI